MVCPKIWGPVAFEEIGGKVLFGRGINEKDYSEKVSAEIDAEVSKIMNEAKNKAEKLFLNIVLYLIL